MSMLAENGLDISAGVQRRIAVAESGFDALRVCSSGDRGIPQRPWLNFKTFWKTPAGHIRLDFEGDTRRMGISR